MLKESDMSPDKCINIARASERAFHQFQNIHNDGNDKRDEMNDIDKVSVEKRNCKLCGSQHTWGKATLSRPWYKVQ